MAEIEASSMDTSRKQPSPLAARPASAAEMAMAATRPPIVSQIGKPTRSGAVSGVPVMLIIPAEAPGGVALPRQLDLDDFGAQQHELVAAVRPRKHVGQVEYPDAAERCFPHSPPPSAAVSHASAALRQID